MYDYENILLLPALKAKCVVPIAITHFVLLLFVFHAVWSVLVDFYWFVRRT